jgi:membrane fusion protein, heavy metal efflux system
MRPLLMTWLVVPLSCSARAAKPAEGAADPAPPGGETVRVRPESRPYLQVEPVTSGQGGAVLRVPAKIDFRDGALSQVGAPLPGRVVDVRVKTGERVAAGAALATLDCPEAASARAAVANAQASRAQAQDELVRETKMLQDGVGTEREKLAAEVRVKEAEAELGRARAAAAFVGSGEDGLVVLRAPIGGTVISRRATVGASVEPGGEPLVEVGDPASLWVVGDVFERDLGLVHEGARAWVELPSAVDPLRAHVVSVGAVVATGLRTAPVRILLEDTAPGLRPGMYGRARIEAPEAGFTLPVEAVLVKDGKTTVVYVERDATTFDRRPVVVSQPIEGKVQVLSGLAAGQRVVTKGALLLDGAAEQLL